MTMVNAHTSSSTTIELRYWAPKGCSWKTRTKLSHRSSEPNRVGGNALNSASVLSDPLAIQTNGARKTRLTAESARYRPASESVRGSEERVKLRIAHDPSAQLPHQHGDDEHEAEQQDAERAGVPDIVVGERLHVDVVREHRRGYAGPSLGEQVDHVEYLERAHD